MRHKLLLIILIVIAANAAGQRLSPDFGASYRIHPGYVNQTEVFICKDPLDEDILFSTCNTLNFIPFFISEGIYVTTDGGFNWLGNDTCTGEPILYHGGDPGITIDRHGTFILTRLGRSPFAGLYSHFSTDKGQSWSAQKVISTDDLERASLGTDATTGPFSGRTYASWVKFALPYPVMVAVTNDGGQSWSAPVQINNPPNRSAGGDLALGPGGEIYICWSGVTDISPFREIYAGFARSTDGGTNWTVTENAFPMNGITGILPEKANIRVNGLPAIAVDTTAGPRRGWIYIVTGQKDLAPAGSDPDIILYRSADGGLSWSPGIRVNQDVLSNGKIQYFPAIEIDPYGGVNILFYDDRNTTSDSASVFLARSADGGDTWNEWEISDHRFQPEPIGGLGQGYQGDNIDLVATSATLWPVWMDNSTGIYQVWTLPLDLSELIFIEDPGALEIPSIQNFPNPFVASTTIRFRINDEGYVSLKIYDALGRLVAEPVAGMLQPGSHEVVFTPRGTASSIFFCRLTQNDRTSVLKISRTGRD